jgi:hypothetical protein
MNVTENATIGTGGGIVELGSGLPFGFEQRITEEGKIYYVE